MTGLVPPAAPVHRAGGVNWREQAWALAAATCLALVYLRFSQLSGRLAQELTYDDVVYANDALTRIVVGSEHGLFRMLATFWNDPPHSPFSTVLAMAGFIVGGVDETSLYATN